MKTVFYACILSLFLSPLSVKGSENISFYEVPLVCHADLSIGCGSRSKPALIELEKQSEIKEAWMNREGTTFAVVWSEEGLSSQKQLAIIQPIFEKHTINFESLKDQDRQESYLKNFRAQGVWYHGSDVDELSYIEAGTIAEKSVRRLLDEKLIDEEEAKAIKLDVETYFKKELVKLRTLDELKKDEEVFQENVLSIYENHLGK